MKLTTEEKAKLKSNIEKIKAYIEAEISPKLCGEAITVYFGNVVHFANGTTGKQYRLYVDGRSVCGGAGNLCMNLLPTGTQEFGCSDFCTRSDAGLEADSFVACYQAGTAPKGAECCGAQKQP